MEWHTIETAPVDTPVMLGRWCVSRLGGNLYWVTTISIARVKKFPWGIKYSHEVMWSDYTHWQPLPVAPED